MPNNDVGCCCDIIIIPNPLINPLILVNDPLYLSDFPEALVTFSIVMCNPSWRWGLWIETLYDTPGLRPSAHLSQSAARIISPWPMRGWGWSPRYNGLCTTRWWWDEGPGTEPRGVSRPPGVKVSHHPPWCCGCPGAQLYQSVVSDQLSALNNRNTPTPNCDPI